MPLKCDEVYLRRRIINTTEERRINVGPWLFLFWKILKTKMHETEVVIPNVCRTCFLPRGNLEDCRYLRRKFLGVRICRPKISKEKKKNGENMYCRPRYNVLLRSWKYCVAEPIERFFPFLFVLSCHLLNRVMSNTAPRYANSIPQ
jgi:hypothetical protein